MKYFLVMNPGSKGGKSGKNFKKILAALDANNINYTYKITASLEDAYRLSLEANKEQYDVIAAVGGDGTINRCLNGFYHPTGRRISKAKFAVIYTGTSPDFCKSYNIPLKLDQAIKVMLAGHSRKIGIGKITHLDLYHEQKTSFFGCCANIGIGASIARNANSGIRKFAGDYAGTFISMIKTLFTYKPGDYVLKNDGREQTLTKVFNISVGRTTYIASGIKVKHDLTPEDKGFYILVVRNMSFINWFDVFGKIYSGREFVNNDIISLQYADDGGNSDNADDAGNAGNIGNTGITGAIEIYSHHNQADIEFDGDPSGYLPCSIELAEDTLDLICGV